jgi:hypothetical protein
VFSGAGVMVMGSVGVTTLHPQRPGDLVSPWPPVPEVAPSSFEDSSRAVRREGDSLWTNPTNMMPEFHSWERGLGGQGDRR